MTGGTEIGGGDMVGETAFDVPGIAGLQLGHGGGPGAPNFGENLTRSIPPRSCPTALLRVCGLLKAQAGWSDMGGGEMGRQDRF